MKLRLLLVRLQRPDIFVLDEPINDLDLGGYTSSSRSLLTV